MKKIVSICMVVLMLFALTACNGDEMQSKIDELEAKLNEQTQIMEKLAKDGDALKQEKDRLVGELAGMEEARQALEELVGSLEEESFGQQDFLDKILNELAVEKISTDSNSSPKAGIVCGIRFFKVAYNRIVPRISIFGCFSKYDAIGSQELAHVRVYEQSGYMDEDGNPHYYDPNIGVGPGGSVNNFFTEEYYMSQTTFSSVDEMPYLGEVSLPDVLFVDDEGVVKVKLEVVNNELDRVDEYAEIIIYYKAIGDYIVLSTEPF